MGFPPIQLSRSLRSTARRASILLIPCIVSTVSIVAPPASPARADARIVNGLGTQDFPTTGALLYSGDANLPITADNAHGRCSGTLIGCKTFLTAAHCVYDDAVASHYQVYLQNGGINAVASVAYHPSYDMTGSGHDVAIVKLVTAVAGIHPAKVNSTHNLQALGIGLAGTVVGFGRTGGASDYGVKRYGAMATAHCDTTRTGGEGDSTIVCWNYDSNVGPAGTDSNVCYGDSGGPMFMNFAGSTEVVGVTSAGSSVNCAPVAHSWDASVFYNSAWILGQLGADSTESCGINAPVADPATIVHQNSGSLSINSVVASFSVDVGATPGPLVFTLNGTDDGVFNPNFFVKHGTGASAASYDCKASGLSVFGSCSFTNPVAGTWSVFVQRMTGAGQYQVTTTAFGKKPTECGDAFLNGGISASDALATLRASVGSLQRQLCICDVNRSGSISASDALFVLKKAVGQNVTLVCPSCG